MTQTNQTYIEEKKQEIEKAILEYLDDNGWKYGEDFYGWLIPSITQALQDAIKYGEEKFVRSIKNDCSCRYAGEIVCCHEDCEKCEPIKKLLAKLTTSEGEGKNFENLM